MPEVLREYPTLVGGVDDRAFVAQIWGRETSGGRWEAWRPDALDGARHGAGHARPYWASGVTSIYLQGALNRSRPVRISAA